VDALELQTKTILHELFKAVPEQWFKNIANNNWRKNNKTTLEKELKRLEVDNERLINKSAQLEDDRLEGKIDDQDVYERIKQKTQKERQRLKARQDQILGEMAQIGQEQQVITGFKQ
jgi:hypothetical protein